MAIVETDIAKAKSASNVGNSSCTEFVRTGDCRNLIPAIETNSVSLILTDPPYFIDGMDDGWDSDKLRKRIKPGVVGSVPAGMKFSVEQGRSLQRFIESVAVDWLRILRPGGFCLVFSQNRLAHRMGVALEDSGFEIRDQLLWHYEGQAKAFTQDHFVKKRPISQREKNRLIKKLGGRKTPQLKPCGETILLCQAPREGTFVDNWDKWETGLIDVKQPYLHSNKFPGTVIAAKKTNQRFNHLTAKPVDLLRHLIRIFSIEQSLVFDPFAGSGSTGVAALLENRRFTGIEIEQPMALIANSRITELAHRNDGQRSWHSANPGELQIA